MKSRPCPFPPQERKYKMNDEHIRKIIEDSYDESKEEGVYSMVRDFYSRKLWSTAVFSWAWGIVLIAPAVYCAVRFFDADQIKWQLTYAAVFIVLMHWIGLIKTFAWQMVHRHSIKRDIKRLELRIAELIETLKNR
jgi:hypothetical protein